MLGSRKAARGEGGGSFTSDLSCAQQGLELLPTAWDAARAGREENTEQRLFPPLFPPSPPPRARGVEVPAKRESVEGREQSLLGASASLLAV